MKIEEQLKELIKDQYGSVRAFCLKYNFPYSTVDNIFKRGIGSLGLQTAQNICDCLNIDVDGLGRGTICLRGDISRSIPVSDDELKILSRFRACTQEQKQQILNILPEAPFSDWVIACDTISRTFSENELELIALYRNVDSKVQEMIFDNLKKFQLSSQDEKLG